MSLLSDLKTLISGLGIPVETGIFSDPAPDEYIVLVPIADEFALHGDDKPDIDIQAVRLSVYTKGKYTKLKSRIIMALINSGITITSRLYIGYEADTGYHHYNIDTENIYKIETEE